MRNIYFTLTGTKYYYGPDILQPGMKITLRREPDNEYDTEAICVTLKGLGTIGHVANSPYTVLGESMSAGRIYDKIGHKATAHVLTITPRGTLCILGSKSIKH